MADRMPTPEEFATAANEVTLARACLEECEREALRARNAESDARNRLNRAEAALRGMTERIAPVRGRP